MSISPSFLSPPDASCLRSGVIWQVEKARGKWKTLNNAIIALLEDAHGKKEMDVKFKNVSVSTANIIINIQSPPTS